MEYKMSVTILHVVILNFLFIKNEPTLINLLNVSLNLKVNISPLSQGFH
jgi:hypothetical protein